MFVDYMQFIFCDRLIQKPMVKSFSVFVEGTSDANFRVGLQKYVSSL